MQLTGRRRDGTEFPADIRLSSIDTEEGLMVIAAVRDVTERNNAHQNLQQMAAVIRNSDAAIIGTTLDGIVTSSNPAAERMLGYSSQEIVGRSIDLFNPENRTGEMDAILATIRAGQPVERFETIRCAEGRNGVPGRGHRRTRSAMRVARSSGHPRSSVT